MRPFQISIVTWVDIDHSIHLVDSNLFVAIYIAIKIVTCNLLHTIGTYVAYYLSYEIRCRIFKPLISWILQLYYILDWTNLQDQPSSKIFRFIIDGWFYVVVLCEQRKLRTQGDIVRQWYVSFLICVIFFDQELPLQALYHIDMSTCHIHFYFWHNKNCILCSHTLKYYI